MEGGQGPLVSALLNAPSQPVDRPGKADSAFSGFFDLGIGGGFLKPSTQRAGVAGEFHVALAGEGLTLF